MEEDEMEMTEEELQKWIRENIKKIGLISPDVLEKCNLLQSLLERREKQAANLLKLCESVTACEAIVKKQYSLLGWEYRDTDSDDDDDDITGCEDIPSSPCEFVHSEIQVPSPPATHGPTPLSPKRQDRANLNGENDKKSFLSLKRELVVVLTRLPKCKIASSRLPKPQYNKYKYKYSQHDSLSDSGSDAEWEPEDDSADSDYSISSFMSRAKKRRKIDQKNEKPAKHNLTKTSTPQANANTNAESNAAKTSTTQASANTNAKSNAAKISTPDSRANTNAKSNAAKISTPQANANTNAKSNAAKISTPQASANTNAKSNAAKISTPDSRANTNAKSNAAKISTPQANANTDGKSNTMGTSTSQGNRNTNAKSNTTKTSSLPANTNKVSPVCVVSTFNQSSDKATKVPPNVPQKQVTVGMNVVARKKAMIWQLGKIMEIVKKDDGGLKYKISFEEKGKSLVSGHHIAFDNTPKLEQLYVGARLVVRCKDNKFQFKPGILAELPSRKNQSRFLVFIDDHTPVYVGLPLLHLVYRPLTDALDDIPDGPHKFFMKRYIKDWPFPHLTQYRVGQSIKAELNGVQQRCDVQVVDCSLIKVVFQGDQHKEWIHRGSARLEHVARFLELKNEEEHKDD